MAKKTSNEIALDIGHTRDVYSADGKTKLRTEINPEPNADVEIILLLQEIRDLLSKP